jgi:hypothetical protein
MGNRKIAVTTVFPVSAQTQHNETPDYIITMSENQGSSTREPGSGPGPGRRKTVRKGMFVKDRMYIDAKFINKQAVYNSDTN